ncbi:MAG: winged helix-turn-helix domain-containing protein [bacterium]|nr:winged helix-turn-helix domain-containing protein [bacterium]
MAEDRQKYRNVERVMKGVANHRRAQILYLLKEEPELSVAEITKKLGVNFRTVSDHTKKLVHAGLVMKRSDSVSVRHKLTDLGHKVFEFIVTYIKN